MHKHQKEIATTRALNGISVFFVTLLYLCASAGVHAQQKDKKSEGIKAQAGTAMPLLTRTTSRHETRRFAYGGTLTVIGAPAGSITIEAWPRNEVDITADIELHANTEEDLTLLAAVNTFTLDEDVNHLRVLSNGMHDKVYMRRVAKKFPKNLLGLPWKIDYHIRVPALIDIEVDAGRGAFNLTGVEGITRFSAPETDANITLAGGVFSAIIGAGNVRFNATARSWRGNGASIQLAIGNLTVSLPAGFSADIDADVLRTGQIENTYPALDPRERATNTPRSLRARTGAGGPTFSFKISDGTLRIKQASEQAESDKAKAPATP